MGSRLTGLRRFVPVLLTCVTGAIIVAGTIWTPVDDRDNAYQRPAFDPHLIYRGDALVVDGDMVILAASSQPVVIAASQSGFSARFPVTWHSQPAGVPGRSVTLEGSRFELTLQRSRQEKVGIVVERDMCTRVLGYVEIYGGSQRRETVVECDPSEHIDVVARRTKREMGFEVRSGTRTEFFMQGLSSLSGPPEADTVSLNLKVLPTAEGQKASTIITEAVVNLPGQGRYYAYARPGLGVWLTRVIGLSAALALGFMVAHDLNVGRSQLQLWLTLIKASLRRWWPLAMIGAGATSLIIAIGIVAARLGHHPFDTLSFQVFAYLAGTDGLRGMYPGSDSVTGMWAVGRETISTAMAYSLPGNYLFAALGIFSQALGLFGGDGLPVAQVESLLRSVVLGGHVMLSLAVFAVAWFLYRSLGLAMTPFALVLLNPAILIGNVTWPHVDVFQALFILLGLGCLVIWRKASLGWTLVAVGVLLKQTGLIFLPVVFLVSLRYLGWRQSMLSAAQGLIAITALMFPFFWSGYHLATLYVPIERFLEGGSSGGHPVSIDGYNFWTLVTGLRGLSGFARFTQSDSSGPQLNGYVLTIATMVNVAIAIVTLIVALSLWKSGALSARNAFVFVGLYVAAVLVLSTNLSSRYYVLALPFLSLGCVGAGWRSIGTLFVSLTAIAATGILGLLAWSSSILPQTVQPGAILQGKVAETFYSFWMSDPAITAFSGVAVMVLVLAVAKSMTLNEKPSDWEGHVS